MNKSKKHKSKIDETDVIREQNTHLCQRLENGRMVKHYDFVKHFKICYIKEEEILYSNENLIFNLDEENDIFEKKYNFLREVSGRDSRPVTGTLNGSGNNPAADKSGKAPSLLVPDGKDRLKSEHGAGNPGKQNGKRKGESIISSK